jgi:hypothetical protein
MGSVAAHNHPLAHFGGVISKADLAKHVQLVLTDRSELTRGREFGVMSPLTWRLIALLLEAENSWINAQRIEISGGMSL